MSTRAIVDKCGYLHLLDGRLRVKIPEVKRQPLNAARIEEALAKIDGIQSVTANPLTGNVLVLFDSETVSPEKILLTTKKLGMLRRCEKALQSSVSLSTSNSGIDFSGQAVRVLALELLRSTMQIAIERLLVSLL